MQKEKETQAREAEEVRKLDIELLYQRAIGAEEHRRESELHLASISELPQEFDSVTINEEEESEKPIVRFYIEEPVQSAMSPRLRLASRENLYSWGASTSYPSLPSQYRRHVALRPVSSTPICRAPIASLDCMDEFSANSQQTLDQVAVGDPNMARHFVSVYMCNHVSMPTSGTPGLRHKNLGKSGLRVPSIGLGLWTMLNENITESIIISALENGINLFDLSEAHYAKGETELGRILKKRNIRRSSVIIFTKIYWSTKSDERGLSRKHIIESVKASLARLQMDYIDVVLLHKVDPVCPMEEVVRAMDFVIKQGYVMYWGTARWTPSEIMDAYAKCRAFNCTTPVVEQTEYHMFCREKAELYLPELYHKIGVGTMVWSALTTGKSPNQGDEVTGLFAKSRFNRKYSTFSWCENAFAEQENQENKDGTPGEEVRSYRDKLNALAEMANNLSCSITQLAVAWCLKNDNVNCLLLGATSLEQLSENIDALQIVPQLSPSVMVDIERILANKPQRPPMVSTLAMRNQRNEARADSAGATPSTSANALAKSDDVEANTTPDKEEKACKLQ
ncbi:voltage-gated potassium channel subunit beta-2 isoform X2 [Leptidea sinapis]|uniref:voltage-gated potassium channel subunit beta-2 isoform X2 n=1 Tax=Leptidea sinapis TaxID=189913 RepID=UPI00213F9E7A|nr:voltage-gated potassium channel subunit beta-2 isoform X2 [Leptidea sinapis]